MGKSWQWSVLCNPSAVGFKSLIWSSSLWLPLQTGPWGAGQGWGLSVLDQLSLCCTQVLAAGEVLHSLVIPVQHTPRHSSPFCGKSFVERKFSFVFFKLYPPWEREEPVWLRQPLRLTHLCHLWLFPCLENFPLHFLESLLWEVCTSTGTVLKSLLSFQSWCFVDHKIPKEPSVLPAGSSACLPTVSPGLASASEGVSPTAAPWAWGCLCDRAGSREGRSQAGDVAQL